MKKLNTVVCGGTFDHFHKGHKDLLNYGLSVSENLVIGVTSDNYIKKFKIQPRLNRGQNSEIFESFKIRKKSLEDYLNKIAAVKFRIVKIDDMFGPTLDKNFQADAIVVSGFTKRGAWEINKKRKKEGLGEFEVLINPKVLALDNKPISSFRIRNGEIDREGKLYINPLWLSHSLFVPKDLREELKKPLGKLIKRLNEYKIQNSTDLITVGDETTRAFNKLSLEPSIAVVDFKVARIKKFSNLKELGFLGKEKIYKVKNKAGSLTPNLFSIISEIFGKISGKNRSIILVDGEEDLSVLPLILRAPLGSLVFYGQPDEGIVKVIVDEKTKEKTRALVERLITRGY